MITVLITGHNDGPSQMLCWNVHLHMYQRISNHFHFLSCQNFDFWSSWEWDHVWGGVIILNNLLKSLRHHFSLRRWISLKLFRRNCYRSLLIKLKSLIFILFQSIFDFSFAYYVLFASLTFLFLLVFVFDQVMLNTKIVGIWRYVKIIVRSKAFELLYCISTLIIS